MKFFKMKGFYHCCYEGRVTSVCILEKAVNIGDSIWTLEMLLEDDEIVEATDIEFWDAYNIALGFIDTRMKKIIKTK